MHCIKKIPVTAKLDSACGLYQFWLSSKFFSSIYFQIGQHVVLLPIPITVQCNSCLTANLKLWAAMFVYFAFLQFYPLDKKKVIRPTLTDLCIMLSKL